VAPIADRRLHRLFLLMSVKPGPSDQVAVTIPLQTSEDVVRMRQTVRQSAVECGFSLVEQTKIVTAASELARNAILHGGGGEMRMSVLQRSGRTGLCLSFVDQGPGIADIAQALRDGFTTGSGLGLGLGGSRRLSSEFEIDSAPGKGTRVTITRWK
jgi:serine/threonine-protein kinase RsbT